MARRARPTSPLDTYKNGVIDETCDDCGAGPLVRCKPSHGFGSGRPIRAHVARQRKAEEKRKSEQGNPAVGGQPAVREGTDPGGEPAQDISQPAKRYSGPPGKFSSPEWDIHWKGDPESK